MCETGSYYAVLALESAIGVFGVRLYEEPHYALVDRPANGIKIRRYAPRSPPRSNCRPPTPATPFSCYLPISPVPTGRSLATRGLP
jgi:hypothetical protein